MNSVLWKSPAAIASHRHVFHTTTPCTELFPEHDQAYSSNEDNRHFQDWWIKNFFSEEEERSSMAPGLTECKENLHCVLREVDQPSEPQQLFSKLFPSPAAEKRPFTRTLQLNTFETTDSFQSSNLPKSRERTDKESKNDSLIPPLSEEKEDNDGMPVLQPHHAAPQNLCKQPLHNKNHCTSAEALEMPTLVPISTLEDTTKETVISESSHSPKKQKKKSKKRKSPEVDLIDGVHILSFVSESELKSYSTEKQDGLKTQSAEETSLENIIVPTKTKDITQIKGWRTKHFSQNYYLEPTSMTDAKKPRVTDHEDSQDSVTLSKMTSAFTSRSLEEYLEKESKLDINFLTYFHPNIKPLKDDAPIFDLGPFCKQNTSKSNLPDIPIAKNIQPQQDIEMKPQKEESLENYAVPRVVLKLKKDTLGSQEGYRITDFNLGNSENEADIETKEIEKKGLSQDSDNRKMEKMVVDRDSEKQSEFKEKDIHQSEKVEAKEKIRKRNSKEKYGEPKFKCELKTESNLKLVAPKIKVDAKDNKIVLRCRSAEVRQQQDMVRSPGKTSEEEDSIQDYGWVYQGMEIPENLIRKTLWTNSSHEKKQLKRFLEEQNKLAEHQETMESINKKYCPVEFPIIKEARAIKAIGALDIMSHRKKKLKQYTPTHSNGTLLKTVLSNSSPHVLQSQLEPLQRPPSPKLPIIVSTFSIKPPEGDNVPIVPTEALLEESPHPIIKKEVEREEKCDDGEETLSEEEVECLGSFQKHSQEGDVPLIEIDSSDSEGEDDTDGELRKLLEACQATLGPHLPQVSGLKSISRILHHAHQRVLQLKAHSEAAGTKVELLGKRRLDLYSKYTQLVEGLSPEEKKKEQRCMFSKLLNIKKQAPEDEIRIPLLNNQDEPHHTSFPPPSVTTATAPLQGSLFRVRSTILPRPRNNNSDPVVTQQVISVGPSSSTQLRPQPFLAFKFGDQPVSSLTLEGGSNNKGRQIPRHIVASPIHTTRAQLTAQKLFGGSFKVVRSKLSTGKEVLVFSPVTTTAHPQVVTAPAPPQENIPPLPQALEEVWVSGNGEPCIVTRLGTDEEDDHS